MDIVHCIDNQFVMQCGVTMTSICENNKTENVCFHILTDGLSDKNKQSLEKIAAKYGKQILIYVLDKTILKDCPIRENDHLSIAAYFRLLMPQILPNSLEKIIYLDCDIVVCRSLVELWNIDISEVAVGVVPQGLTDTATHYNRLDYDRELGYFNSGVMLVNLTHWRQYSILSKSLEFIKEYPSRIEYWDQDALNYVLKESKKNLPLKYNVQSSFLYRVPFLYIKTWGRELEEAMKNPVILHYTNECKPWQVECDHPLKPVYIKFLKLTEWRNIRQIHYYKGVSRLIYIAKKIIYNHRPSIYVSYEQLTHK